ncbi:MAG: Ldh family oxidoreductase, partial [Desulfofustis sp.]|nr:Ldh family oxidoreductase [Desulfofustis sp.]
MESPAKAIKDEALYDFVYHLFARTGMVEKDAETCAECLVQTNLWGIDSHGVLRVPIYIKRLLSGAMNKSPEMSCINDIGALEVWNGDDGCGYVVGRNAMGRAIAKAEEYGIAAVGVIRSNHFGAAALYTKMAVNRGMVGIAMTNVVPNVVAPGGAKPIVGNNPFAVSVPTFDAFPFTLDISLSSVAGGKLLLAIKNGEKIPLDWATDKDGRPTDDPQAGFNGFLLPVGGHKGYGMALVIDLLCGVLTGGAFLHGLKGMYKYPDDPSLTGHFFIVLNPLALMEKEVFKERMDDFYQQIKASPMWDSSREMLMPGEIEYRTEQQRRQEG